MKVVLAPWKCVPYQVQNITFSAENLFQVRKNWFFRSPRRWILRQDCSSALKTLFYRTQKNRFLIRKKRFLSDSENSLFQVAKTLEIASWLFWRPQKASPFRFGKIAFSAYKVIFSGSEKLLFQVKSLQILSRLFWRPTYASRFRFGKIAFSAEKGISFRFGKIAFSGRQDARNCVTVVLSPRKTLLFQIQKNRFLSC